MPAIAKVITIVNWSLLVFGCASLIGWIGAAIAYSHEQYFILDPENEKDFYWYELFNWTLYIAFTLFIIAGFVRFILFLVQKIWS